MISNSPLRFSNSFESQIVRMVQAVNPAVVSIVITRSISSLTPEQILTLPTNDGDLDKREIGGGSGFIVSRDGLVVTNKHVINDEEAEYYVYTNDGNRYPAEVVAIDPVFDIAIVKIAGNDFPYLTFEDSDNVLLGQTVVAIGNALGEFRNSISVGVVSGLSRSVVAGDYAGDQVELLEDVIQTDAAINPGNSGGPLLDTNGHVIGVNIAIARGSDNINFALPANIVKSAVVSVEKRGVISRPFLGVRYVKVTNAVKQEYNLSVDYGVLVQEDIFGGEPAVVRGSPAARAGLREGDIILAVDNILVKGDVSLSSLLRNKQAGDIINLRVNRAGRVFEVKVQLGEYPV